MDGIFGLTLDQSQPMAGLQSDMGCLYLAVCDKPWVDSDCSLKSKPTTRAPSERVLIPRYYNNPTVVQLVTQL